MATAAILPRPLDYICQVQYSLNPGTPLTFSYHSRRYPTDTECVQETWKEFLRRIVRIRGIYPEDMRMFRSEFGNQCAEPLRRGDFYTPLCDQPMTPKRLVCMMKQYMSNHEIACRIQFLYYNPAADWYVDASRPFDWASKEEAEEAIRRTEDPTL